MVLLMRDYGVFFELNTLLISKLNSSGSDWILHKILDKLQRAVFERNKTFK